MSLSKIDLIEMFSFNYEGGDSTNSKVTLLNVDPSNIF